jgi:anti-sigma-K factor RskA
MDEVKFTEWAALYAVGALDGAERHEFEQYLRTASPEEQRALRELTEVSAMLPLALPQPAVPARVKARLMARVNEELEAEDARPAPAKVLEFTPRPKRFSFFDLFSWQPLLTAATLLLAITSGLLLWQNSNVSRERDQLAQEVAKLSQLNVATQKQLDELVTQTTKFVSLEGKGAPNANAKVFWDTTRNQWVVYVFDLPAPPTDKSYQLWFVTSDQQKVSAQVFETKADGRATFSIPVPQNVAPRLAATAVTLEPKGGSPQPSNANFYLLGQVGA